MVTDVGFHVVMIPNREHAQLAKIQDSTKREISEVQREISEIYTSVQMAKADHKSDLKELQTSMAAELHSVKDKMTGTTPSVVKKPRMKN